MVPAAQIGETTRNLNVDLTPWFHIFCAVPNADPVRGKSGSGTFSKYGLRYLLASVVNWLYSSVVVSLSFQTPLSIVRYTADVAIPALIPNLKKSKVIPISSQSIVKISSLRKSMYTLNVSFKYYMSLGPDTPP